MGHAATIDFALLLTGNNVTLPPFDSLTLSGSKLLAHTFGSFKRPAPWFALPTCDRDHLLVNRFHNIAVAQDYRPFGVVVWVLGGTTILLAALAGFLIRTSRARARAAVAVAVSETVSASGRGIAEGAAAKGVGSGRLEGGGGSGAGAKKTARHVSIVGLLDLADIADDLQAAKQEVSL